MAEEVQPAKPVKGSAIVPRHEKDKENVRRKIMQHWDALSPADKKNRRAVVRDLSEKLDIPAIVIEQHLAEWESGKSA